MKIAILGGTGSTGRGLAARWALKHDVSIGSRSSERASEIAKEIETTIRSVYRTEMRGRIIGELNCEAGKEADVLLVTLPPDGVETGVSSVCFGGRFGSCAHFCGCASGLFSV